MTIMSLDSSERAVLAGLADLLIPAGEDFPSASEAGVAGDGVNQVLEFRPDMADALKQLLRAAAGRPAAAFLAELRRKDPAGFGLLTELVPGAYFLNPQVRARLGYRGQGARPIDPHPDYLDDGLLQSVLDRGPVYRPTPGRI
jgi:hypothetical protein